MEVLNLNQVRVTCRGFLNALWEAEHDRIDPRPLSYKEMLKASKMSGTTFNRWLSRCCEGKIITKYQVGRRYYYTLGQWGNNVVDLDASNDFWNASVFLQMIYEKQSERW